MKGPTSASGNLSRSFTLLAVLAALVATLAIPSPAHAAVYEVGPGKTYAEVENVPWESIAPGDTVNIYWRSTPYRSKWVMTVQGTQGSPVLVHGVPDGSGALPIIDGENAITRTSLSYWSENRGIIKLGEASVPADATPSWITFENLQIRNGRLGIYFYDDLGAQIQYNKNAAAFFIVKGDHITVRNCIINGNGNGFFTFSTDAAQSSNIVLEGCYVYDNGADASIYEHNSYCESLGITYQYNHYGPLRTNCPGNNLKDRSAGMVIRYNWIESGNRQLDIVDPEDSGVLGNARLVRQRIHLRQLSSGEHVRQPPGSPLRRRHGRRLPQERLVLQQYRRLHPHRRDDHRPRVRRRHERLRLPQQYPLRHRALASSLEISNDSDGIVNMTHNWAKAGYLLAGGSGGTVNDDGTTVTGTSPGFTNEGSQDYTLAAGSACINAGTALHASIPSEHYLYYQYVKHQGHEARPNDGQIDIGANERPGGAIPDLADHDYDPPRRSGDGRLQPDGSGHRRPAAVRMVRPVRQPARPACRSTPPRGVISGTPTIVGDVEFHGRASQDQQSPPTATRRRCPLRSTSCRSTLPARRRCATRSATSTTPSSSPPARGRRPTRGRSFGGSLPAGLSLASSTGVISGSPTTLGTSNFTVRASDSQGVPDTDDKAYSITVVAASGASYWVAAERRQRLE